MKRLITRSTILAAALGACAALAGGYGTVLAQNGAPGGRPAVIATVRLGTVVEKLDKRAAEFANLQAFRASAQKEQETRKADIDRMQQQLDALVKANGVENPTAEMLKLQEDLGLMSLRFQAWSRFTLDKADIEQALVLQDLYRSIKAAAAQMASASGYDLVVVDDSQGELRTMSDSRVSRESQILQQIADRRLLYANPGLDITDELITRMNNEWKAAGGAKPQG
jgi:Skp family chaperone for outer membrane proteins